MKLPSHSVQTVVSNCCILKILLIAILFNLHALTLIAQNQLWGMTGMGGSSGVGVIYKVNADGSGYSKVRDFTSTYPGAEPKYNGLTKANNGKLYGITRAGGIYNSGVLFEFDPATSTYTAKYHFENSQAANVNGAFPSGQLCLSTNGKLYGTTGLGGASAFGTIFEFDPTTSTFTKKIDFTYANGANPQGGGLVQHSNGKMYGLTSSGGNGGQQNYGVLFEYDPVANTCISKQNFTNSTGYFPLGELVEASNGKLYGVTNLGGANGMGTLFEYDPNFVLPPPGNQTGLFTKRFDFSTAQGSKPVGGLSKAGNQKLYGVTYNGGAGNVGALFEYDPASLTYTKKFDFSSSSGSRPVAELFLASNGKLYGTTEYDGSGFFGVLFEYDAINNIYTKKYEFSDRVQGGYPMGVLAEGQNGKLYGTTGQFTGLANVGTLFEFNLSTSTFVKKLDFSHAPTGGNYYSDFPDYNKTEFVQASNGKFYGITHSGGTFGKGTLFEFDPVTQVYTKRVDFNDPNGSFPVSQLVQAFNGKLYGLTKGGGSLNSNVLFEFNPTTNVYTKKIEFTSQGSLGNYVMYGLVLGSNGKLYGMTNSGGALSSGTVFEYDPNLNTCIKKLDIDRTVVGNMITFLMLASNGKIYGVSQAAGPSFYGTLFEYNIEENALYRRVDWGSYMRGNMVEYTRGKLLGAFENGGSFGRGRMFEFNLADNSLTIKYNFYNPPQPTYPQWLTTSTTGIVGLTVGTVFEYDPVTPTVTKKFDFSHPTGYQPHGKLVLQRPNVLLTTPANGAINQNISLNITSKTVAGASSYTIEVSPDQFFQSGVITKTGAATQAFVLPTYSTLYYARVKTNLSPDYGLVTQFTTGAPEFFAKLTSPANGATVVDVSSLAVQSALVTNATTYTIQLSTDPSFATFMEKSGSRTQTYTGLSLSTLHYARVKTNLSPNWGVTTTFTTGSASELSYVDVPVTNAVAQLWSLNVTANTITGASSYTIQLAQDATFTTDLREVTGPAPILFFSSLAYGIKYYSRVTTDLSPGLWGPVRNFTTDNPADRSYVVTPANNAIDQLWNVNVTSNTVIDATTYTIQLSPFSDFSAGIIERTGSSPTQNFNPLSYDTKYYTRVSTNLVPGVWGPVRNFTTDNPADRSYVVTPANNAIDQLWSLSVTANLVTNAVAYTIQLSPNIDFSAGVIEKSGSRTQTFNGLVYNTLYYSRVSTDLLPGVWGPLRNFTTDTPVDRSFVVTPADNAVDQLWSLTVTANLVTNAITYTTQLSPTSDFSYGIIEKVGSRTQTFSGLAFNTQYFSRVATNLVPGVWGPSRKFTTTNPVSAPYVITPANGATGVAANPTVQARNLSSVGVTSYTIELNTASDFTGSSIVNSGPSPSINFSGLLQGTTYYDRVSTNLAPGQWGPARNFTTLLPGGRLGNSNSNEIPEEPSHEWVYEVHIYGNPFSTNLSFMMETPQTEKIGIKLMDINGRIVYESTKLSNEVVNWENNLAAGIYILRIQSDRQLKTVRLLRE